MAGSREKILARIGKSNSAQPLPDIRMDSPDLTDHTSNYIAVLERIGGKAVVVEKWSDIQKYIDQHCTEYNRIVSAIPQLPITDIPLTDSHALENVDLAVMRGHFGVAENGATWITDECMGDRALPFIAHNLALVIAKSAIIPTLHQAYERINAQHYDFGTFIAGPSKTADIEQSLVLGAHGPKSLIVFLLDDR
jgi:L-lactate dehydrogenase complex protein LldG